MLLGLMGVLFAGTMDTLKSISQGDPDISVVCSSASQAIEGLKTMGSINEKISEMPKLPAQLFAPQSSLAIAVWPQQHWIRMRFQTSLSLEDVATLMEKPGAERKMDGKALIITTKGGEVVRVGADKNEVEITSVEAPNTEASVLSPLLAPSIDALNRPGCAMMMSNLPDMPKQMAGSHILLHLPFEKSEGIYFAVTAPALAEIPDVTPPQKAPPAVSSYLAPQVVMVLGVSLAELDIQKAFEGEKLRTFKKFRRAFPIADGTVIALLDGGGQPIVGMSVPMERHRRDAAMIRRITKILKKKQLPFTQPDKTHISIQAGKFEIQLTAQDGRYLVANNAALLMSMAQNAGQPWISGKTQELVSQYPIVMVSHVIPVEDALKTLDAPISLALGFENGVLSGYLVLPLSILELQELLGDVKDKVPVEKLR